MIALRDRKGQLWTARLTLGAARRVRDLAGLDVMALVADDGTTEARLYGSPGLAADALFALCLPECDRRGVTDRGFGRRFRGVPARVLVEAIRDEVREFFRVPGPPASGGGSGKSLTPEELWLHVERMSGVAGLEPDGQTFGELVSASEGKRRHDWSQTAQTLSCLTGLGGKQTPAAKLDPTGGLAEASASKGMPVTGDSLSFVASIFMG